MLFCDQKVPTRILGFCSVSGMKEFGMLVFILY